MILHNCIKLTWRPRMLALLFSVLTHVSVQAQGLSLFADNIEQVSDMQLVPESVEYQRQVQINQTTLAALTVGDHLLVTTLPGESIDFELVTTQQFLNGDRSWRGVAYVGGQLQTLSLVIGSDTLLATINNNSEILRVTAKPITATGDYSGYLFIESQQGQLTRIDDGGVLVDEDPGSEVLFDVSALSGSDVTVVQTLSSEFAAIGDQIDVSIEITNNLSTSISNEELNVLFVLDETELVSSSSACSPGSTGAQSTLACSLPTIAAGASTTVEYSVRLTDDSYPQIASGVFVGDIFGDNVRNDAFVFVYQDTLQDSDGDGESDFNEAFNSTNPNDASSVIASNFVAEIDLMFLYTDKFANDVGSGSVSPETKINEMVEVTNGYYANSDANVSFRPIYYSSTSFAVNDDLNSAFTNLRNNSGAFSGIDSVRDEIGADIIVLVDGLVQNSSTCGLGTTPGVGFEGEFYHPTITTPDLHITMFAPGNGCSDIVLAHELGHNLGLNHSRREAGADATFSFALGHGVDGSFATIMANPSDFPGSNKIALFSNPQSTDCNGLACGVSRTDLEQGADAVFTINHTRHQISHRRTSRVLPITSVAGSSNLIMYGGANRSSDSSTSVSTFSAQDSIDVSATLLIPSEHQGQTGTTYAVISVDGAGFFYRDANGDYQSWNGELNTLQGRTAAHALSASENLDAFDNFVPANFGVDAASVTVFFAYSVSGTDVFVYSSNGVPFTIQ